MIKKILALILCMLLAISWAPPVQAATEEDLRQAVTSQFDAYAKSLYRNNADDDAIDVMLKQALYGKGKTLHFSEKDPVTAALYESNLFRLCVIENLVMAAQVMPEKQMTQALFGTDSLGWHDFALEYRVSQYHYNDTLDPLDDEALARYVPQTLYTGPVNSCDKAMMLIVGGCNLRIRMHLLEQSLDSVSYQVNITVSDEFEFDGSYDEADKMGYNTTFSKLISALGPILGMDEFFWHSTSGFKITVPLVYRCSHESGDYRWEHNGTDFVAVQGDGLTPVEATRVDYKSSDGTAYHYYQLEKSITLLHNVPWVLEFRQQGSSGFMLGPDPVWSSGNPYFLRTADHMVAGCYDSSADRKGRHQYGFQVTSLGYSCKQWHTFRIENRIAADGSNMLWLLIDGQELGPMTHYFYNPNYVNTDMETEDTWLSGVDFTIGCIGGTSFPIKGKFDYIAIWQDGPGNPHDPFTPGSIAPTCTKPGHNTRSCLFCGYTEVLDSTPALGHRETTIPGKSPTCTETGLTEGSECSVCGETVKTPQTIPALGHKESVLPAIAPSCTGAGLTEGTKCDTCGDILKVQKSVPALGHKESVLPSIAPTCTDTGLTEGVECTVCGEILTPQKTVSPLAHNYEKGYCRLCDKLDPDFLTGDANFDGTLTYQDALLILRASIGLDHCEIALCDMDGNGRLTYQDALIVLRASIGLS